MKIATFNVNNVNRRLDNLRDWMKVAEPDVVCLQELKAAPDMFPEAEIGRAGYESVWVGQKTWNGVAILSRIGKPDVTRTRLPGAPEDVQARYVEAAVGGILIGCLYLPNGNPQPGPKFDYKLDWMKRLQRHAAALLKHSMPTVLAGDFNVVPTARDIYQTTSYDDDALVQPESRAAFKKLLDQGWIDSIRHLYPKETIYTFWDYMRNRWPRNAGLRIDHVLISPNLESALVAAGVDREVRGRPSPSDHAPVWIELRMKRGAVRPARTKEKVRAPRAKASAKKRGKAG